MQLSSSLELKITFLGTGTSVGVPMVACSCYTCTSPNSKDKRLRSSIFIETASEKILIDAGPDLRMQLLSHRIEDINQLLITHHHKDHVGGLDDIRAITLQQEKAIDVYGNDAVMEAVHREIPYAFGNSTYLAKPNLVLHPITKDSQLKLGDLDFLPIEVWHGDIKILGYRTGKFTYITDCSKIEEEEKEKIKGSEILVINGIRWEEHHSHFTIEQAIALAEELQIPKTYITHISHQLGRHNEVQSRLPEHIFLAYDGLCLYTH